MTRWLFPLALLTISACSSKEETAMDCLGRSVSASSLTGTVNLNWTAPLTRTDGSPLEDLSGYRIYYGIKPDQLSCRIDIQDPKATTWEVTALSPGKWHFAVVSLDSALVESKLSAVVSKQID